MLVLLYFCISLLSAFLLFMVQPMAAKAALPVLGGSPFVWNGCMLFFQSLLLGGYLYAHAMNLYAPLRRQVPIHLTLLALAVIFFPTAFATMEAVDPSLHPIPWLVLMLGANVGLPFFVMSATAPLIQRWFAATGHRYAENPYFLYAASNAGSFGALLSYPFLVEPHLALAHQLSLMHAGLATLTALFAAAGIKLLRIPAVRTAPVRVEKSVDRIAPSQILYWLLLSLIPSSLLYAITTYITMDLASVPLFWVVPLALYLLTFINAFATRPIGTRLSQWLHMPVLALACLPFITMSMHQEFNMRLVLAHLALFFLVVMSCHSRLADSRPPVAHLTQFYLWVSLGGVLGGIFNTLLAPILFTDVIEYPLMLLLSVAVCIPLSQYRNCSKKWSMVIPVVIVIGVTLLFILGYSSLEPLSQQFQIPRRAVASMINIALDASLAITVVIMMVLYFRKKLVAFLFTVSAFTVGLPLLYYGVYSFDERYAERNFFGISRVAWDGYYEIFEFWHGTTSHGIQSTKEDFRLKPVSYYAPLIEVFNALDKKTGEMPVAVMGLGVGTIACFGKKDQLFDFFEIDPAVERIARDDRFFTYLRDCPPKIHVTIGDGRLGLARQTDGKYGLIVADAFTSDAVPIHLLTEEAVRIYLSKLDSKGALAFNISNRYVDLKPVLSAIAGKIGVQAYRLSYYAGGENPLIYDSEWVLLTRDNGLIQRLTTNPSWEKLPPSSDDFLWRDEYSNIFKIMYEFESWLGTEEELEE